MNNISPIMNDRANTPTPTHLQAIAPVEVRGKFDGEEADVDVVCKFPDIGAEQA